MGLRTTSVRNIHASFGQRPHARKIVILTIAGAILILYKGHLRDSWKKLREWNERLKEWQPWKIIAATLTGSYILGRLPLLLGTAAPPLPEHHYSPNFMRARRLLTALDAGVLSSVNLPFGWMRDMVSPILGLYYLMFPHRAEDKVDRFRRSFYVDSIRICWEKGHHPLFRLFSYLTRPSLAMFRVPITFPRPQDLTPLPSSITDRSTHTRLFFDGTAEELAAAHSVICQFPGGGFVANSPASHDDYIAVWAKRLKVPILAVNYHKAPECPFPIGLEDCFATYRLLVETEGACIGIQRPAHSPLNIICVGDSAGGNFAAAVTIKAIQEGIRVPRMVHLIYPCLDLDLQVWMDDESAPSGKKLTSMALYSEDGVLPTKYFLLLADAYILSSSVDANPRTDPLLSPVVASQDLLRHFPPCYIHVGGVDPLRDDSVKFLNKIRKSNPAADTKLRLLDGLSHAYMQITNFLPEGKEASELSMDWMQRFLTPLPATIEVEQECVVSDTPVPRARL